MEMYDSSPTMLQTKTVIKRTPLSIPFDSLPIGKSVAIPFDRIEERQLRIVVSAAGKKFRKTFRCIKHKEQQLYEVGRVADPLEVVAPVQMPEWDSSEEMSEG